MLNDSKLFNFLNEEHSLSIQFLEGQKIIQDFILLQELNGKALSYYRDGLLTIIPLINFLKPKESMGFYIDSEDPYFRLKIEANFEGLMRSLLWPESFNDFPEKLKGIARIVKLMPGNKNPYTGHVEIDGLGLNEVVAKVLKDSFQVKCSILISNESDQSLLIQQLPPINPDKEITETLSLSEYVLKNKEKFLKLMSKALDTEESIIKEFSQMDLLYLGSKKVQFHCNCSREGMIHGLISVVKSNGILSVIDDDKDLVEVKCDYCKKTYSIRRDEFSKDHLQ